MSFREIDFPWKSVTIQTARGRRGTKRFKGRVRRVRIETLEFQAKLDTATFSGRSGTNVRRYTKTDQRNDTTEYFPRYFSKLTRVRKVAPLIRFAQLPLVSRFERRIGNFPRYFNSSRSIEQRPPNFKPYSRSTSWRNVAAIMARFVRPLFVAVLRLS